MTDKTSRGKTRAGTEAQPFPWEEALEAQLQRTKKRFKGLSEDPINELRNITRQYLYDPTATPEENEQKINDFTLNMVGSTGSAKAALQKASEVFGKYEGKTLMATQADRTKVGGGFLGGPGFSGLQLELPAYKEAQAAWGVAHPAIASTIAGANRRVPEGQAIWAPMLGHPEQHRSNQMVFDQILNKFRREAKKGSLDEDLRATINERLAGLTDKEGKPLFSPDIDIMGKDFRKQANTFDKRAATAEIMGGKGVGGKKGSIIDYPEIIRSTTDPAVVDAPTGAIGHRAFQLTGDIGLHPELHPAFPYILRGEDIGQTYAPVPRELALRDFIEQFIKEKGRPPGVFDLTRGYAPQQFISEDWLTNLQKHGYADGGMATQDESLPAAEPEVIDLDMLMMKRMMKGFAVGGAVYNTTPDKTDSGEMLQGPPV